ncbi:MAG: hypothetical protein ACRD0J_16505 [Acidimicrobiales bacterium]
MTAASALPPAAPLPAPAGGRAELARLLARSGVPRRLLRQRVALFVAIGIALGVLHLAAGRSGGDHVALTAMLGALVPVFAPVCFVPVVFADRRRGHAPASVAAVRLGVVAGLGWVVAGVHLAVWKALAATTASIGGPGAGDIPFMIVTVLVTTAVAVAAYQAPARPRWAEPSTVASVVVLYVGSFVVHAALLDPSLATIGQRLGAGPGAIEAAMIVGGLVAVWALMRREVHDGAKHSA